MKVGVDVHHTLGRTLLVMMPPPSPTSQCTMLVGFQRITHEHVPMYVYLKHRIQDNNYDYSMKGDPFLVVWLDSTSFIFCYVHAILCGDQSLLVKSAFAFNTFVEGELFATTKGETSFFLHRPEADNCKHFSVHLAL